MITANGQPTDSLLHDLYMNADKEDAEKYELLCKIASSSDNADTILKYSEQAIELAEKLDMSPADAIVLQGTGFLNSFRPASALECFVNAASYYEAEHNNIDLARTYNYMAEAYNRIGNHDNERLYLNNAIKIFRQEKDSIKLAITLHNLGFANYSRGHYDTALVLYAEANEIFEKVGYYDYGYYAYNLGNTGLVYSKRSEFDKAEDCLLRAIEILTEEGDNIGLSQFMTEYAGILQHRGEINKALDYATRGFNIAAENGLIESERDAAYRLAQLYHLSGSLDSAWYYQSLYVIACDSIYNRTGIENIQKMADLRTEFEVAQRQAEVDRLQRESTIKLIVIGGLLLILLLALALIILYYQSLKRSKKLTASLDERNILLEKQSKELKEHQYELTQQKEELQSALENLKMTQEQLIESEKMAAMGGLVAGVAHEMNTPVGVSITAISNLQDDIQEIEGLYKKDQIKRSIFKEFLNSANEIARLIQKNLERTASLIQSFKQVSADQVTEQQRVFALKEYLKDILTSLRPKFRDKKINVKIDCDDSLTLNSYPGIYAQIFTNLLLNSLQHGFHNRDKGTIDIQVDKNQALLKIQYSDDGDGISKKDLPHIFEPFYTSDQHRGTGLGLNIIYNLVRQKLHGTITCESEPGKGVLFQIEVPVK